MRDAAADVSLEEVHKLPVGSAVKRLDQEDMTFIFERLAEAFTHPETYLN